MAIHLVWFRNDLRLHDHEPLLNACRAASDSGGSLIALYVVDPRFHDETAFGFPGIGPFRRRFLRESLQDLSSRLGSFGSKLHLQRGSAENVIGSIAETQEINGVYFHEEVAPEEKQIEQRVAKLLNERGITCQVSRPASLYTLEQMPFELADLPDLFSKFRRKVEKKCLLAEPLETPGEIPSASTDAEPVIDSIDIEKIPELNQPEPPQNDLGVMSFRGGETSGLSRINDYFWKTDCISDYKETRNGMLGADYSSKFSPWLALGCLSARKISQEVTRYETERTKNKSTYWMIFELLWRDFFALVVQKHGARVFQVGGLQQTVYPWRKDWGHFRAWKDGRTGFPLIDANMRELAATGFMSNRGRQNAASFLTKNLGVDWRMGAEWFESMLIDYDPCSNYGNWNYVAGVGNDAREFRWFNTLKQSKDYDPAGLYVRHWLPELADVPNDLVHQPWQADVDYPDRIVDLFQSADQIRERFAKAE